MGIDAPICRLSRAGQNLAAALCYEAHSHGLVKLTLTQDGGHRWSTPVFVDTLGAMATLVILDETYVEVVWQASTSQSIVYKRATYDLGLAKIRESTVLTLPSPGSEKHFVGAFQDLVFDDSGGTLTFFGAGAEWSQVSNPLIVQL